MKEKIRNFRFLSQEVRRAIKGDNDFFAKVLRLNALAEKYLDYISGNYNLSDEEFLLILRMIKSCLFLNIKVFKRTERKMADFRQKNPEFEKFNSPNTDNEPWKGIKDFLYNPDWNDDREEYRESVRPLAKKYLQDFDDGQLDHLERFLPIDCSCGALQESVQNYLRNNLESIKFWAVMKLNNFEDWLRDLSDEELLRLDEEIASLNNKRDFSAVGVNWRISYKSKKLRAVRQLRFGF